MGPPYTLPFPHFTIFFFFFLSILFPISFAVEKDESFSACEPFTCGNITDLSYPFWSDSQPDFCGHSKFYLDCNNGDNSVTMNITNQSFHVIEINVTSRIMRVVRVDFWENKCPDEYTNITLDYDVFNYTLNNQNTTLLYDCNTSYPTTPQNLSSPVTFQCPIDGVLRDSYFLLSTEWGNVSYLECNIGLVLPVLMYAVKNFILEASDPEDVIKEGFEVTWEIMEEEGKCEECRNSSGRCGRNVNTNEFRCFALMAPSDPSRSKVKLGIMVGVAGALLILICATFCYFKITFWKGSKGNQEMEAFIRDHGPLALTRYKFSDIKKMTKFFRVKLGQGGYGAVYKGELLNGCHVAVKILTASKGNGRDFINEVAGISRTSHINVVTLLGFCLEGKKKALIYEFMPNGSLDKFINTKADETSPSLSWENLYQIALGIARGLEYLHRGCNTRILHFDIKPHNILLDESFCPKISDFGLAKLHPRNESIISLSDARGTIGYLAPEVLNRNIGGVSHKSDVYSYGMILLDIAGGRRNMNNRGSSSSEKYFPEWIYDKLEQGNDLVCDAGEVTMEEHNIVKKITIVGLWCIQTFPSHRPTISKVIDKLEGGLDSLEMPPKPVVSSPTRIDPESFTTSIY